MSRAPARHGAAFVRIVLLTGLGIAPLSVALAQRTTVAPSAWRFSWTITPTADGKPIAAGSMVLDVAIWNGVVRIVARDGPMRALTGDDGAILLRATDSSLSVVKPTRKEVLSASSGDLGALLGGPAAGFPLTVSNVRSATRLHGAGAPAFGYATRNVALTQDYTLELTTPTVRRSLRTEQVHDLDISRDIARLDPGFRTFAEQFARSLGLPSVVRARLRAMERSVPRGMPVRIVTTAVTVTGSDTLRTTTRAEMTSLRREPVDTTTFIIPTGYRVTDMSRLLQRGPRP